MLQPLADAPLPFLRNSAAARPKEKEHSNHRDSARREVDKEAPAPADMLRQRAAHDGGQHDAERKHAADEAHVEGARGGPADGEDDVEPAAGDARGADARERPARDEGVGGVGGAADRAAEEEDGEEGLVDPAEGEEGGEFAGERDQGAGGERVGGGVPRDVGGVVEVGHDGGNGLGGEVELGSGSFDGEESGVRLTVEMMNTSVDMRKDPTQMPTRTA